MFLLNLKPIGLFSFADIIYTLSQNKGTESYKEKLIGISLGARIREGDCEKFWNGRKLWDEVFKGYTYKNSFLKDLHMHYYHMKYATD
jgi:hypothetical protein